jgi:hypothetical protein
MKQARLNLCRVEAIVAKRLENPSKLPIEEREREREREWFEWK